MQIIKIDRFWPARSRAAAQALVSDLPDDADALGAFGSEDSQPAAEGPASELKQVTEPRSALHRRTLLPLIWFAVVMMAALVTGMAVWRFDRRLANGPGSVTFESSPAGAEVFVSGVSRGRTPLTLPLAAGAYDVTLKAGASTRSIKVDVRAGASVVQHLEMPIASSRATETGSLEVQTDPARLAITIDGVEKGPSPLRIDSLAAGEHHVLVRSERGVIRRTVSIGTGQTTSLMLSAVAEPAAPVPGWVSISSPLPMQLREAGRVIGTTEADRLMLPSGTHEIEILEPALRYHEIRKVTVAPGKTTSLTLQLPNGMLNINASPWADVWIDGERVGETPLANVARRIGRHEIVFRHPELGEHRESVVVTQGGSLKIGVDLRKK